METKKWEPMPWPFWAGAGAFVILLLTGGITESLSKQMTLPVKPDEFVAFGIVAFVTGLFACGIVVDDKRAGAMVALLALPFFAVGYHFLVWFNPADVPTFAIACLWIAISCWAWSYKEEMIPSYTPFWAKLCGLVGFFTLGVVFTPGSFGLIPANATLGDVQWIILSAIALMLIHTYWNLKGL